mgnify:CR=1 FL=1
MARKRNRSDDEAGIDLTPMLDVVFIMLIFFIVTTSFIREAGIEVNRPSAETAQREEQTNILVAISANGQIWIDRRQVDVRAVRANIERMHAENPQGTVIIQADEASKNGLVVKVMDAARQAGVGHLKIALRAAPLGPIGHQRRGGGVWPRPGPRLRHAADVGPRDSHAGFRPDGRHS